MNTARSAVIEIKDGGRHFTKRPYNIVVNGKTIKGTNDLAQRSRNILKQGGLAAYTRNGGN